jgi:hypothetical protein
MNPEENKNQNPLQNLEDKVELAMDEALEMEQEEVPASKMKYWWMIVVAVIVIALIAVYYLWT